MAVSKLVLGLNARNYRYIKRFNKRRHKQVADNKLATKEHLIKNQIPTTGLVGSFRTFDDARSINWGGLPKDFVLKPAHGYGGRGILVVRKWNGTTGEGSGGETITRTKIEAEIFGIIDGAYSLNNLPDQAFIEERVKLHGFFKKLGVRGVPDIRIIVWNKVPVMAMLRLPTEFSFGKANLHLGALGVGIDIRTGITTHGVLYNEPVTYIPGKKVKVRGLKIPHWDEMLIIATSAQESSELGFVGVDIILDRDRGPLVLEINARPGLAIQIANQSSLRTRLERLEGMEVPTIERGIDVAKTLFADAGLEEVEEDVNILGIIEKITILGEKKKKTVYAKIDTGAYRTALDIDLVHELGLDKRDKQVRVIAGSGTQTRHTVRISFRLRGVDINTIATYSDRKHMRFPIIIGRKDLRGFLVDPSAVAKDVR